MSRYAKGMEILEMLLTTQFVLPLRRYLSRMHKSSSKNDHKIGGKLEDLLTPLTLANKPMVELSWRSIHQDAVSVSATRNDDNLTGSIDENRIDLTDPIPLLLDLFIKANHHKPQRHSNSHFIWDRAFFRHLALCVAIDFEDPESSKPCPHSLGILESMLRVCLKRDFSPPIFVLKTIVAHFSGLSGAESWLKCNWEQISVCIRLDLEIVSPTEPENAGRQPDILQPLLNRMASIDWLSSMPKDVETILLLLVDSFVTNRDLLGFFRVWKSELVTCLKRRLQDDGKQISESVWEHDLLLTTVASKLSSSLTSTSAIKLLEEASDQTLNDHDNLAASYSLLVTAECIIEGDNEQSALVPLKQQVASLYVHVAHMIQGSSTDKRYRWRLWRILVKVSKNWPDSHIDQSVHDCSIQLRALAKATIARHLGSSQIYASYSYEEALLAWRFLIGLHDLGFHIRARQADMLSQDRNSISALFVQMQKLMDGSNGSTDNTASLQKWHGRRLSISDLGTLLLACVALAVSLTSSLECLSSSELETFLAAFMRCVFLQIVDETESHTSSYLCSWHELWHQLQASVDTEYSLKLAKALSKVQASSLLRSLEPSFSEFNNVALQKQFEFALSTLKYLRPETVKRDDRTQVVNAITTKIVSLDKRDLSSLPDSLTILLRFIENPRKLMDLISRPEILWNIADLYDIYALGSEAQEIPQLRQLTIIILQYVIDVGLTDLLPQYLTSLHERCGIISRVPASRASIGMMTASFELMAKDQRTNSRQDIKVIQENYFLSLIKAVTAFVDSKSQSNSRLLLLLESISSFANLLESLPASSSPENKTVMSKEDAWSIMKGLEANAELPRWGISNDLMEQMTEHMKIQNDIQVNILIHTRNILARLEYTKGSNRSASMKRLELEQFRTTRSAAKYLFEISRDFMILDAVRKAAFLRELVPQTGVRLLHPHSFQLLRRLLNHNLGQEDRVEGLKFAINRCCSELIAYLTEPGGCHCLAILSLENLIIKDSWAVSQYAIDSLLSAITILTTVSEVRYDDMTPGKIYLSLCSLFRAILNAHRAKLGGRYHIVLDALGGLLSCLFEPYTLNDIHTTIEQPHWLLNNNLGATKLGGAHAREYSRLLESLCDPSPSAVKHSNKLNDETKKAKAIAGQYLQYTIQEFCALQLQGRLAPEVRKALNPGLYAILNAMSKNVRASLASSLDDAGKAIFKALYDDYKRFGR